MVDLGGYVIILVETKDKKIKLYGSPADKADLEIGDEILEVNGKSLEGATHTEVISHIHQCIRSRTICLRVKRKSGNKLAQDLAANSNVQDAFVIAVEKQARERLERLSALKKIKPVDMTKLSQQLSNEGVPSSSDGVEDDGDEDADDAVVASIRKSDADAGDADAGDAEGDDEDDGEDDQRQNDLIRSTPDGVVLTVTSPPAFAPTTASREPFAADASPLTPATCADDGQIHVNGDHVTQIVLTPEVPPPVSVPSTEDRELGESWAHFGTPIRYQANHVTAVNVNEGDDDAGDPFDAAAQISDDESSGVQLGKQFGGRDSVKDLGLITHGKTDGPWASSSCVHFEQSPLPVMGALNGNPSIRSSTGAGSSRGTSQRSVGESSQSSSAMVVNMAEWDTGPHREMAVDVPDSFVARTKTPPRYPPPRSHKDQPPQGSPPQGLRKKAAAAATAGLNGRPLVPSRDHLRIEEDGTLVNRALPPQVPSKTADDKAGVEVDTPNADQLERIRKYQEEERKKREKEERIAREDEFLRSSLRGSRKLQALEKSPPTTVRPTVTGVVNIAYTTDEDPHHDPDPAFTNAGLAWALAQQDNYLLNAAGTQKVVGIQDVTATLQRVQQQLKKNGHGGQGVEADLAAVQSLLLSPAFRSALTIHSKVQEVWCCGQPTFPITNNVQQLVSDCMADLEECACAEAVELIGLLSRFEVEGLLYAHDRIADQSTIAAPLTGGDGDGDTDADGAAPPESAFIATGQQSTSSSTVHPADKTFKIIRLEKSNEPLGATVRNDGESVMVGRIVRGGVAERSGLLHEGDEILEVNGVEVRGKSINDVCDLVGSMSGTITFLIVPATPPATSPLIAPPPQPNVVHLKAHFDYDPEDDLYIPCKELGISFMKGDILHVISQEDANWWQAFREGEEDQTLAGLIPSRTFQQHRREAVKQAMVIDTTENEITTKGTFLCARKVNKKKKKTSFRSSYGKEDAEEILTYEEVGLYYPRANHKRPIVLIGPPNIGRKELREMLMQDNERFAPAIPHTSRTKKDSEINSQDYHFISRAQFEADIVNRKFVEHGEYEKAYYGTTVDAIRAVVNAGKFCVLNLHPQSLKILKDSDLMPFVVFVAPPSLDKLRAKKRDKGETFKDDDLKEIIEKAREMEEVYGHYFDMVIVNGEEERTYSQLVAEVNRLEREPQWVPATWLRTDHK